MKFFKTIALSLAAMATFAACEEKPQDEPAAKPDEITVTPEKLTLKNEIGAGRAVVVQSSCDWTLATADGKPCEWIEPSVTSGQTDAVVKFSVAKLNDEEKEKTFSFVFTAGKATTEVKVTLAAMNKLPDEIMLSSSKAVFNSEEDVTTSETTVVSSTKWTLAPKQEGGYAWVKPDVTEGEDGAKVTFTVDKAQISETSTAIFIFTVGEKTAEYTIEYNQAPPVVITVTSDEKPVLGYVGQDYKVLVTSELQYDALDVEIVAEPAGWLTKKVITGGDVENGAEVILVASENESEASRTATVTVKGGDVTSDPVTITQLPKSSIIVEKDGIQIKAEGEEMDVKVTSNVEFTAEAKDTWLEVVSVESGVVKLKAAPTDESRTTSVTLTEKNPGIGTEAVTRVLTVVQATADATFAAKLTGNRLFPKFDSMNNRAELTYECMLYLEDINKTQGQVMTIMGIENMFLLRLGDSGRMDQFNVVLGNQTKGSISGAYLNTKTWYHVALTFTTEGSGFFKSGKATLYLDGRKVGEIKAGMLPRVPITMPWNYAERTDNEKCFWIGYSFDASRDFHGMISEVRIWDRALTESELQEPGHFYDVDPKSEGLYAYWKFTGAGDTIENLVDPKYPLYGEKDVKYDPVENYPLGTPGIEWVQANYKK